MRNSKEEKEQYLKMNFFKKVWYSIIKFEKYPEMAATGVKKAIIYFTEMILVFSILFTGIYSYYVSNVAEFEDEDMNLSQKIISALVNEEAYKDTQINQSIELLKQTPVNQIIIIVFISVFIAFFIATLLDVFTLSLFGLLTCWIAKIKMNYKAIFNMSIYALTLPIILRIIYSAVTILTNFEIKYFDIMYTAISYIILAAAIFMIKSDLIKQHFELMKIIEESKEKIERTITKEPKDEEQEEEEKEDKNKKEDNNNDKGTEEQGSNA